MGLKYNIGAGSKPIVPKFHDEEKWYNDILQNEWINLDIGDDITLKDRQDADLIYCSHFLEYFDKVEVMGLLRCWFFAMIEGGELFISVPDFSKVVDIYRNEGIIMDGALYGKMGNPFIYHKSIFDRKTLREALLLAGFKNVTEFESFHDDCSADHISLNLKCRK